LSVEKDEDIVEVKFMKKCAGSPSRYVWPEPPEVFTQDLQDIVTILQPPTLLNARMQLEFKDSVDRIEKLKAEYFLK